MTDQVFREESRPRIPTVAIRNGDIPSDENDRDGDADTPGKNLAPGLLIRFA